MINRRQTNKVSSPEERILIIVLLMSGRKNVEKQKENNGESGEKPYVKLTVII